MKRQDLIESLISQIENENIEITFNNKFPIDAVTNVKRGFMVVNLSIVTPFKLAHELVHIFHGDTHRQGECDTTSPQEKRTNKEAILLLWEVFEKNGGTSESISQFIEITNCPDKLTKIIILKSKIKDWDKEEIHTQIDEYLDHSEEEPEYWNLYKIMDACHIDYKWECLVKDFIEDYRFNYFKKNKIFK
ncbi:hypothetical protein V6B05_04580 [Lactococcus garvieae]|uniref:hypothetical protein n=1 Tax=Lactococcus garvieae TaxID=1363 RepID=UPI001F604815|nr:hypothetical protein [Lactococcus garvieae]MCI3860574.1 hypothetical protein [Lactococcus garvieae]